MSQYTEQLKLMGLCDGAGNLISSTAGAINVQVSGLTLGTTDKSAFTYGVTGQVTLGGVYQDTSPTLTAGTQGAARVTQYRGLHTNLRTSGGVELLGSQVSAASLPVVIASDQTVPVSGTFWQATQPVSGTVTANIGTTNGLALDTSVNGLLLSLGSTTSGQKGTLALGAVTTAAPSYTTAQSNALSLTTAGALRVDNSAVTQPVSGTFWQATQPVSGTFWQATQPISGTVTVNALTNSSVVKAQLQDNAGNALNSTSNALNVSAAQSGTWTVQPGNTANTTAWLVKESVSGTSTLTNVASSASSVSILASNANRLGAMFFNDSTQVLYLKLGTTASNSSYTVQLAANGYYELPPAHIYTGAIDGIWASANGNLRVTELT